MEEKLAAVIDVIDANETSIMLVPFFKASISIFLL